MPDHVLVSFLKKFDRYPFCVKSNQEEYRIGEGEPEFTVNFKRPVSLQALMTSTSLALGEAYMDGSLEIEGDLYHALNRFLGQMGAFSTDKIALKKIFYTSMSKKNQREEVQSHYDIGNDFYRLWLDDTMSYSCGYFRSETDTLEQAQVNKVDYILDKLNLEKGMYLLDIGCGWGFLLIEAAKKYGMRGLGITLSNEQYREFQRRIEAEHLEHLPAPFYQRPEGISRGCVDQKIYLSRRGGPQPAGNPADSRGHAFLYCRRGEPAQALQQGAFMLEQEFSGAPRRGGGNVRRAVRADVGIVPVLLRGHLHEWNH